MQFSILRPGFSKLPGAGSDFRFAIPKEIYPNQIAKRFRTKVRGVNAAVKFIEDLLSRKRNLLIGLEEIETALTVIRRMS